MLELMGRVHLSRADGRRIAGAGVAMLFGSWALVIFVGVVQVLLNPLVSDDMPALAYPLVAVFYFSPLVIVLGLLAMTGLLNHRAS